LQDCLRDAAWQFPKARSTKAKQLHRIFDEHRVSSEAPTKVKASCSELIGAYGLVRYFVEQRPPTRNDTIRKCLASFNALCAAVDIILTAKRGLARVQDAADALDVSLRRFMQLHIVAYGDGHIKPKHHWLLDVPNQFRRDSLIIDALVIERNHLLVKGVADQCKNTSTFEQSVMRGIVHTKLAQCKAATGVDTLLGKIERFPGTVDTVVADRMWVSQFSIAVGDIVARSGRVGRIAACLCEAHRLFVVVEALPLLARSGAHSMSVRRPCGQVEVWPAVEVELVVAWAATSDGNMVVVVM